MHINDIQKEIIGEFSRLSDWLQKYTYLTNLGKKHQQLDSCYKTEKYALPGCQSQVWIIANIHQNRVQFRADSDSLIIRGILSLLIRILNNQTTSDIINADLFFLNATSLNTSLSPTRANGVAMIVKQMLSLANNPNFHG